MALSDKEILGNVLAAYVSNNQVPLDAFREMVAPLMAAAGGNVAATPAPTASAPVAETPLQNYQPEKPDREPKSEQEIAESVGQHHIVSFIDGRPYKTLRRHIGSHGYNDHSYKAHFGLPADYPMVAPAYSEARSKMSKDLGLGRPRKDRETVHVKSSESVKEAYEREQREAEEKERVEAEKKEAARQKSQAKARPNPKPSAKAAKVEEGSEQPDV